MTNVWILRLCVAFAVAVCLLAATIALRTTSNMHPDELIHGDAFCYFQNHVWPPPPNLASLRYSPDGMSRVYNGEIVYWLWGALAQCSRLLLRIPVRYSNSWLRACSLGRLVPAPSCSCLGYPPRITAFTI